MQNSKFLPIIGLEIHAELKTRTKMFCGCPNPVDSEQVTDNKSNTLICPVCLGLPGSLPVPNERAIELTLLIGKALGCTIAPISKWDRKNYFYPDLPKGYQISQYDLPLATKGRLAGIGITRIHLEEDTGKLLHPIGANYSLVDFNRSGVPLVELVTEPEITSAHQAKEFAQEYQRVLRSLGVSDANMERGQMRVEANISLDMGTKVEIKNLNSFRAVERAIEYEVKRQTEILERGEKVIQETRGWNETKQATVPQRTKETASDYRYFPEPDIPPLNTSNIKVGKLPELPRQTKERYSKLGVSDQYIEIIINRPDLRRLFDRLILESAVQEQEVHFDHVAKILVNRPLSRSKNLKGFLEILNLPPHQLKVVLSGERAEVGSFNLNELTKKVVDGNPKIVEDIKKGKTQAIGVLIGKVMKETRGGADPQTVKAIIEKML